MTKIIESTYVTLEPSNAKADLIVEPKPIESIKNLEDFVQVHVESGKHTILVSKYRLDLTEEVKRVADEQDLDLTNEIGSELKVNKEESSGRNYISNLGYKQAMALNQALGYFTLSTRYFLNFLHQLHFYNTLTLGKTFDGKGNVISAEECEKIFDEITKKRDSQRSEWLDGQFTGDKNKLNITYSKINSEGKMEKVREELDNDILMEDRTNEFEKSGIDFLDLLEKSNLQGFPKKDIRSGDSIYWHPRPDAKMMFSSSITGPKLHCYWNGSGASYLKAVRPAFLLK